jgi:2'-5' RNA ligase
VAQSVELLLDERAEAAVRRQWNLLTDAGLPSERRAEPRPPVDHHCPHITLFAGDAIPADAEVKLSGLVGGLRLELQLGAVMVFGPRRGRAILVRQVTPSVPLLQLQEQVAAVCGAEADGQFGAGRWAPHVTLARRLSTDQVGDALVALDWTVDRPVPVEVTACRRWDGSRKTAWLV